ncbi:4-hydroxybenzoate decarboxylase subunit D [Escherichia coli]|uniref:4-hydroxybenzoate decarboxylase subunit D n=1 Tax=Escherichia coli TaxID=562 RepID=A0A377D6T0_ECOLX|nr:4-hydroxybenzoate decarboxylase subunit D [Escherichia coli]
MICPRCADEQIEVMAKSPVKDTWTVYQCQNCFIPGAIPNRYAAPAGTLSRSVPHDAERY